MTRGSMDYYDNCREESYIENFQNYLKEFGLDLDYKNSRLLTIHMDINDCGYDYYSMEYKFKPSIKVNEIFCKIIDKLIKNYFMNKYLIFCYCLNKRLSNDSILQILPIELIEKIKYNFSYGKIYEENRIYFNNNMKILLEPFLHCDYTNNFMVLYEEYTSIIKNSKIDNVNLYYYLKDLLLFILDKKLMNSWNKDKFNNKELETLFISR